MKKSIIWECIKDASKWMRWGEEGTGRGERRGRRGEERENKTAHLAHSYQIPLFCVQ